MSHTNFTKHIFAETWIWLTLGDIPYSSLYILPHTPSSSETIVHSSDV